MNATVVHFYGGPLDGMTVAIQGEPPWEIAAPSSEGIGPDWHSELKVVVRHVYRRSDQQRPDGSLVYRYLGTSRAP